ncbi:MAG: hypothetical protein COS85_23180 [Armatimonadetes bacterium CG07_land_8_20_14_0_80_59_28]|nr:MAG: hypothetical protein COS85_23180 [Armatimonadetes bacterium CG07_land_8_20_14_0_80_59_28]PJB67512.1 MAG: hypothetical protein CO095_12090 [Armatimonadetes bacterium CG_4_9_14_3_um_filter_58_7]
METPVTFDALLDSVSALPPERQETLIDLVRQRLSERRREEIARNAVEARALFASGSLPRGTVEDLMAEVLGEEG